jgi:hypothetical protein
MTAAAAAAGFRVLLPYLRSVWWLAAVACTIAGDAELDAAMIPRGMIDPPARISVP